MQQQWLGPLIPFGLKIFGNGWHHLPVKSELQLCLGKKGEGIGLEMSSVISSSKVTFNMVRAEHGCAHSMKTFEIPACGGFMLTNWTKEQALFFENEKEAVFFNTIDEMLDKTKYYLSHEAEREKIRQGGMKAVVPHTYVSRAKSLLEYLETGKMNIEGLK